MALLRCRAPHGLGGIPKELAVSKATAVCVRRCGKDRRGWGGGAAPRYSVPGRHGGEKKQNNERRTASPFGWLMSDPGDM